MEQREVPHTRKKALNAPELEAKALYGHLEQGGGYSLILPAA